MKILTFNDSQHIEVQDVCGEEGRLIVRAINITSDELKMLFQDRILTRKMTLKDGRKNTKEYENYTVFSYIKENAGGIFEVEMEQEGKDTETRLREAESEAKEAKEKADQNNKDMQMAIAEISLLIAAMIPGEGGNTDV